MRDHMIGARFTQKRFAAIAPAAADAGPLLVMAVGLRINKIFIEP